MKARQRAQSKPQAAPHRRGTGRCKGLALLGLVRTLDVYDKNCIFLALLLVA